MLTEHFLEITRLRNALLLISNPSRGQSMMKMQPFFYEMAKFAKADESVIYEQSSDLESYAILLSKRYPVLQAIELKDLMKLLSLILMPDKLMDYEKTLSHDEARADLLLIALKPNSVKEYELGHRPYIVNLILADDTEGLMTLQQNRHLKNFILRLEEIIPPHDRTDSSKCLDAKSDYGVYMFIGRLMMDLKNITGRDPDLSYMRAGTDILPCLLSVGYTHTEIFRALSGYGSPEYPKYYNGVYLSHANHDDRCDAIDNIIKEVSSARINRLLTTFLKDHKFIFHRLNNPLGIRNWLHDGGYLYFIPHMGYLLGDKDEFEHLMVGMAEYDSNYTYNPPGVLRDLFEQFNQYHLKYPFFVDLVRWVQKHKRFWNSFQLYTGSCGEEVKIHTHTVVEKIIGSVKKDIADGIVDQRIDIKLTPAQFVSQYSDIITKHADSVIRNRKPFPDCPFELKDVVTEDGNELRFERILDSVRLNAEGQVMNHCIGGYTDRMVSGKDFAFHVDDPKVEGGYTLHTSYHAQKGAHCISQIRGRYNSNAPDYVIDEINKQLSSQPVVTQ